ncbi:MAG: pinensin family lanthipeptide [Cyclobacteriaceae bacterium]
MKTKKLNIEDLSVQSFITDAASVRGGRAAFLQTPEEHEVSGGGGGGHCGTEDVGCIESKHNCFAA